MVADEVARYYRVPAAKLEVIYNGVDTEVFHPGCAKNSASPPRRRRSAPGRPVLLFVGSGFERKGHTPAAAGLAALERRDARLVIVGADRKRKASGGPSGWSARYRGTIHFTGPLKDVRPWYGAADGFVCPPSTTPAPTPPSKPSPAARRR